MMTYLSESFRTWKSSRWITFVFFARQWQAPHHHRPRHRLSLCVSVEWMLTFYNFELAVTCILTSVTSPRQTSWLSCPSSEHVPLLQGLLASPPRLWSVALLVPVRRSQHSLSRVTQVPPCSLWRYLYHQPPYPHRNPCRLLGQWHMSKETQAHHWVVPGAPLPSLCLHHKKVAST